MIIFQWILPFPVWSMGVNIKDIWNHYHSSLLCAYKQYGVTAHDRYVRVAPIMLCCNGVSTDLRTALWNSATIYITIMMVCLQFTAGVVIWYHRFTAGVVIWYHRFTAGVMIWYHRFTAGVVIWYHRFTAGVVIWYHKFTAGVVIWYHKFTAGVVIWYHKFTAGVVIWYHRFTSLVCDNYHYLSTLHRQLFQAHLR